jgi:protein-S-isoprenylcysteine O-methyltransferase Ste14
MNLKVPSLLGFGLMIAGIVLLVRQEHLLAASVPGRVVQILAVGLMIAARITFGSRSFHAAANPTAGALVTTGPYALLRHPIYAAVLYFVWAAAIDHQSWPSGAGAALTTAGASMRMYAEEQLLARKYPDYPAYRARTARVVPFVL